MNTIVQLVGIPLEALMSFCYTFTYNYGIAIALFTLMTKVILFPVSMWVQRNSIKMVQLTPELNQLKLKYYGDKDTIAEETQLLYKRENYHPLASTIPMFIQLLLLIGVIGAVRGMLEGDAGTMLIRIPAEVGGAALLMPVAAGGAALLLGLAQNHLNPLQREQGKAEQWMTNGFSIAISLVLGAFVPLGVGIYWICSNLFTILQQVILNSVIPPKKYIDYEALEKSRQELAKISSLGGRRSKEEKQREKADYKRFFSIANKHLVFYSEKSGFYKYYESIIQYLLSHSNVVIHYITSDPNDAIFQKAIEQSRIKPYYIGEKRLITLMMKMDADIVVMTMPDLENYHIKRSYIRKDIEYVYVYHGVTNSNMVGRKGCFDHYDTILCVGPHQIKEIRETEEMYQLPEKRLIECGYPLIEKAARKYEAESHPENNPKRIVVAPSWQPDNILDYCMPRLLDFLVCDQYQLVIRPHPEYIKRYPNRMEQLTQICKPLQSRGVVLETDFSTNVFEADLLITDWSTIAYEYAFTTLKPVLFIDTPMKVLNEEYVRYKQQPVDITWRNQVGRSVPCDQLDELPRVLKALLSSSQEYHDKLEQMRSDVLFHFGNSDQMGGRYILEALKRRKQEK